MKRCNKCNKLKTITEFNKHSLAKDGLRNVCKTCYAAYHKLYYKAHREHIKNRSKNWRQNNRNLLIAGHLRRRYGLTIEKLNSLYSRQKGCCAICDRYFPKLVVDHNHTTGNVRQLLCNGCNRGLGMFQDNPTIFRSAAAHLEYHENKEFR